MNLEENKKKLILLLREKYHIASPSVLSAMSQVPREKFLPKALTKSAYENKPLTIGYGQTISQPYTVAFMTDLLKLSGREKVLEIGTGSGYQSAILSLLSKEVYSIERIEGLAQSAKRRLKRLGYLNVHIKRGQGEDGWSKEAPFDAILVTAGMRSVPNNLVIQLKKGGILVAPVGSGTDKKMFKLTKYSEGTKIEKFGIFRFVPFIEE